MPRDPEFSDEEIFKVIPLSQVFREEREKSSERQVILVVDDEQIIADTLSVILSSKGYSVLTAYDGETALRLARDMQPNLMLSDVVMPGMTGITLAIAMTKAAPNCKVLLFSGQAATIDLLLDARNAGYDFNVLNKPIHPKDLLRHISEAIEQDSELVSI